MKLTADYILKRVGERYATCRSYKDFGRLKQAGSGGYTSEKEFWTHFVRPGKFRFEWTESIPLCGELTGPARNTFWSDGNDVYSRLLIHLMKTRKEPSLELAIAGATGISSGRASEISALLGLCTAKNIRDAVDLRVLGMEVICEEPCHHLRGTIRGNDCVLWIGADTFALRRIREHHVVDDAGKMVNDALKVLKGKAMDSLLKAASGMLNATLPRGRMEFSSDTLYVDVAFDEAIDDAVFEPKF